MTRAEKAKATQAAGYREKYAMQHGTETRRTMNGHILYIFRYSAKDKYQDANGATYDATRGAWIQ